MGRTLRFLIGSMALLFAAAFTDVARAQPATVSVSLNWTASTTAGATTNVYQESAAGACVSGSAANGTTCKKLANVPNGTNAFTDTTPAVGSKYWYVVRAANASGIESANSNEILLDLTTPNPPSTLHCVVTMTGTSGTFSCQ